MDTDLLFNKVTSLAREGIHIIDKHGNTLVYSRKMAIFENMDISTMLSTNLKEIQKSVGREYLILQVCETGKPILDKVQNYVNIYGVNITTLNSIWPILEKNEIVGAIQIALDITEARKLSQKAADYLKELNNNSKINSKIKRPKYVFENIIGESPEMLLAKNIGRMASKTSSNVLIIGQSGTGKELFAQSIHNASDRCNKTFIAENCAALPENLLESTLFGTSKGGFTGAIDKLGLFQLANEGTLLLDEINALPLGLQAKLLRVLQEGSFRTVGGSKEIEVDVRIISITNEDPIELIRSRRMREDLFYRLSVVNLHIPPLRDRGKDLDLLTEYFINKASAKMNKNIAGIDNNVKNLLMNYNWPGNVRELSNVIEGAINLVEDGGTIGMIHMPYYLKNRIDKLSNSSSAVHKNDFDIEKLQSTSKNLSEYFLEMEEQLINQALAKTKGNISQAASMLGITRQALQYKLKRNYLKEYF